MYYSARHFTYMTTLMLGATQALQSSTKTPFLGISSSSPPPEYAQFNFLPYRLTDACLDCSRDNTSTLYSCDIKFKWFDPNSVKENNVTACTCSYTWKWDGQTTIRGDNNSFDAVDFVVCTNQYPSVFEMRVNNFMGPSNLTLFMSHFYKDSTLWGAPYLYAQTWAMPNLSLSLQDSSDLYRNYTNVGPILANITGLQG